MTLFNVSHRVAAGPVALTPGAGGSWESTGVSGPGPVIKFGTGDYGMWYEGLDNGTSPTTNRTGYATSTDGVTWSKYGSNPIFSPSGAAENNEASFSSVFFDSNASAYRAYYHGGNNSGGTFGRTVFTATAPNHTNGGSWTRGNSGAPVILRGGAGSGAFDESFIADAKVIQVGPTDYRMWYHGARQSDNRGQIGYATSTDGITWSKSGSNPVIALALGTWEDNIYCGCPLMVSATEWYMWYCAVDASAKGRMGLATSSDGITWTKYASNPVMGYLVTNGVQDSIHVWQDSDAMLRMVYGTFTVSGNIHNKRCGTVVPPTAV